MDRGIEDEGMNAAIPCNVDEADELVVVVGTDFDVAGLGVLA
jgi:hypothetical protein